MRKRIKETEENTEPIKKYRALNTHIILWIFLFTVLSVFTLYAFLNKEKGLGVICGIFAIISISPLFFTPINYIFTQKDITIIYLFGAKEKIEWWEIRKITEKGSWIGGNGLPHYSLKYPKRKKCPFFVSGEITKTRRTKKLLKRFYIKEIK